MVAARILLAAVAGSLIWPSVTTAGHPAFTVHVETMPDAAFVNTFVVETAAHVVVVDPGFSEEHASRVASRVQSVGKPIEAVLLTHGHVDHYGALSYLDRDGAPVISSAGVARQIEAWDAVNYARFGMAPPSGRRQVDRVLQSGESIEVDGVSFTMMDAGPGESYDDVVWLISGGGHRAALVGDLVMFGIPPFLQSGHSADWLASLERAKAGIQPGTDIYIGHDLSAANGGDPVHDASILDWQGARLTAFRSAVAEVTGRERLLEPSEVAGVVARMHEDAPENLPAFDFLITTTANVLAAELMLERERERFEPALQRAVREMAARAGE